MASAGRRKETGRGCHEANPRFEPMDEETSSPPTPPAKGISHLSGTRIGLRSLSQWCNHFRYDPSLLHSPRKVNGNDAEEGMKLSKGPFAHLDPILDDLADSPSRFRYTIFTQ